MLCEAVRTVLMFSEYLGFADASDYPTFIVVLLAAGAALVLVLKGIEGIARVSFLILLIFVTFAVFVFAANISDMKAVNLIRPGDGFLKTFISSAADFLLLSAELFAGVFLFGCVNDKKQLANPLMKYYGAYLMAACGTALSGELVFSGYASVQPYPAHSLAVIAEFSIFQRLDVIGSGIVALLSVMRIGFLIAAAFCIIIRFYPNVRHRLLSLILCSITAAVALGMGYFSRAPRLILETAAATCCMVLYISIIVCSIKRRINEKSS